MQIQPAPIYNSYNSILSKLELYGTYNFKTNNFILKKLNCIDTRKINRFLNLHKLVVKAF